MLSMKSLVHVPATLGICAGLAFATDTSTAPNASHVWGDFNGDSFPDLFLPGVNAPGRLLANQGDGSFRDVTEEVGLDPALVGIQASWSDFDSDGDLDLLVLSGDAPAQLFENESGTFRNATENAGLLHIGVDRSAEWTDFDGDGRPDLLLAQEDRVLLYNGGRGQRFELVELVGEGPPVSATSALGSTSVVFSAPSTPTALDPGSVQPDQGDSPSADARELDRLDDAHLPAGTRKSLPPPPSVGASAPPVINPNPFSPTRGSAKFPVCANSLHDEAGIGCVSASTVPTDGMLYPLSRNLFVAKDGDVGVGTYSPRGDLHVAGDSTGLAVISPTGLAADESSELLLSSNSSATSGFRFVNTLDGGLRFMRIRGVNFLNDPYVSIMSGFGYFGLNVDVPLYRLHAFEESMKPQVVADGGKGQAEMRIIADSDGLGGTRQAQLSFQQYDSIVGRVGYFDGVGGMQVTNENSGARLELTPTGDIQVEDRDGGVRFIANGGAGDAEVLIQAGVNTGGEAYQPRLTLTQINGVVRGQLGFFNSTNDLTLSNQFGSSNLILTATGEVHSRNNVGASTFVIDAEDGGGSALRMYRDDGVETVSIASNVGATDAGYLRVRDAAGLNAIILDGQSGKVTTRVLTVTGGADVAEPFEISGGEVLPGMVVSIDSTKPGELRLSTSAYDRTVAGIVSGAGGIEPGLMLSQEGTIADGQHPVALSGRVYCLADTSNGAIQPGDMLTSSALRGHAMKATDADRAFGAVIGKAMTALEDGTGLVLVLVNLQ